MHFFSDQNGTVDHRKVLPQLDFDENEIVFVLVLRPMRFRKQTEIHLNLKKII